MEIWIFINSQDIFGWDREDFPYYIIWKDLFWFFFIFISIHSLYRGDLLYNSQYILARLSPPFLPLNSLPTPLKKLQKASLFYFMYVYEAHQLYSLTFISFIQYPHHKYPLHTIPMQPFLRMLPVSIGI
jgi:hypothetical protein